MISCAPGALVRKTNPCSSSTMRRWILFTPEAAQKGTRLKSSESNRAKWGTSGLTNIDVRRIINMRSKNAKKCLYFEKSGDCVCLDLFRKQGM